MTWRRMPLRALYRRREVTGRADLPLLSVYRDHGVVPRAGRKDNFNKASDDLTAYKLVRPGDLVLNKMKTWQGSLGVSAYEGIVSPAYFVARRTQVVDDRFMHHLLRSTPMIAEYGARSKGIRPSQWDMPWDEFVSIKVSLPSLREQRMIAGFLDLETKRIESLITKKRLLSGLLDERLGSAIRFLLTASSGAQLPLKRKWRVIDCKHRTPTYLDEGYPVVSPGDATPGRLDLRRAHRFVGEADYIDLSEPPRRPERGSIIYSRNASIGIASYVDTDERFCMGQDVCLITSRDQNQLFLTYVLNTLGVDQLDEAKIGSTFSRVNVSQILEVLVPCPPRPVQDELAARFDRMTAEHDRAKSALRRQIELLQEHRQALITAAVTGELDIPGVAA